MFRSRSYFKENIFVFLLLMGSILFPWVTLAAQKPTLELKIDVEERTYALDSDIHVIVTVRNVSPQMVSTYVGPAFTLRSDDVHIWAPVAFDNASRELKRGETMLLRLEPFEEKTFEYDLNELRWDSVYSAVWPTRPFLTVIAAGSYTLMFEIRKKIGEALERFESNSISVVLLSTVRFEKDKYIADEESSRIVQ
ncbi:MAG: hypothetical protein ABH865_09570 [Candidatus Omnitrophota bacterium]|nr:hypothetical protein [Candidatus Omnitrophota bacterium]